MSNPVITERWAGNLDCSGPCRRKRLVGSDFSKQGLERHRKKGSALKCKQCVSAVEVSERKAAQDRANASASEAGTGTSASCSLCHRSLPLPSFSRSQLSKGDSARCRECVEASISSETSAAEAERKEKMEVARARVREAEAGGDARAKLKAATELSALEGEHVTGLKPIVLGRGRGRGSGRGGRWSSARGGGRGAGRRATKG
eukprot:CAMPEP_0194291890 /NCGR_PEP_ID=MMETSP0169-20130528/44420_1 /TAXON_ID=218684 /ORGANISM="Corethron pennatum, Strain L29A3" /LENGTH=202 /DNA_ID=CAMNT_0039039909 /DNA_START=36 /DNA_END=644 /DNA_ORIENTATION=-